MRPREEAHRPVSGYGPAEETAHALTHGFGVLFSVAAFVALVLAASASGDGWRIGAAAVFGTTLVLLYTASTAYHAVRSPRAKRVLQRLDHAAIFLLIAGTYTPFTAVSLSGGWGWTLFALIWSLAVLGIAREIAVPHRLRRLSVLLPLLMGWLVVGAADPLVRSIPPAGLVLLVAGGVAYTLGVPFYAWERLPYHHAVWHVFVLAGSACHFSCVLGYVIPAAG